MGNSASSASSQGDGIPFVSWRRAPTSDSAVSTAGKTSSASSSVSTSAECAADTSISGLAAGLGLVGVPTWHFAEPSCYRYDRKCPRVVTSSVVFSDPPKADSELRNAHELVGNIVVVERGGRVHFPDIVRRVLTAGAVGCVFIERPDAIPSSSSLFDGFHSSGRQRVSIPIVLLAACHTEQLLHDRPSRVSIEFLSGDSAIKQLCKEDLVVAAATAARAGEVDVLKHILYSDTSGSIREV
ncbi:hypothetical protein ATCC90586_004227 [Pythium insidiosum]|nr:hypothetical protein ATCC90586_004227 [Pythium insidiosum]